MLPQVRALEMVGEIQTKTFSTFPIPELASPLPAPAPARPLSIIVNGRPKLLGKAPLAGMQVVRYLSTQNL